MVLSGKLLIIVLGFTVTLSQRHNFRIEVYDDYPDYHDEYYQDYQSIQPPLVHRFQHPQEVKAPVQYHKEIQKPVQVKIPPRKESKKDQQDFSKIPGVPGVDFPLYHRVPETSFSCDRVPYVPGMYANPETGCQAYHVCHDGREGEKGASFLCSNGTLFNQKEFACDWWYNVDCAEATKEYRLNGDLQTNPFVPKDRKEAIARERLRIAVY